MPPIKPPNPEEYVLTNGLRHVYPYPFTYTAFCKTRWIDRTVVDVYTSEFSYFSKEMMEEKILAGKLLVNNKPFKELGKTLKRSDSVQHIVHRHELPIVDCEVPILFETDSFFVVEKPASWPVHPCGRYRKNSLSWILENEYGYSVKDQFFVHRLDRMTSGVLVICKQKDRAKSIQNVMLEGNVHKIYIARVRGKFPSNGVQIVDVPIDCIDRQRSIWKAFPGAHYDSKTAFLFVDYDESTDTSLVICKLFTGRTHQIRVHLQYLGFPIWNDPCYGGRESELKETVKKLNENETNNLKRKKSETDEENNENNENLEPARKKKLLNDGETVVASNSSKADEKKPENANFGGEDDEDLIFSSNPNADFDYEMINKFKEKSYDSCCAECKNPKLQKISQENLIIDLHAWIYFSKFWYFQTPKPPKWILSKNEKNDEKIFEEKSKILFEVKVKELLKSLNLELPTIPMNSIDTEGEKENNNKNNKNNNRRNQNQNQNSKKNEEKSEKIEKSENLKKNEEKLENLKKNDGIQQKIEDSEKKDQEKE